MISLIHKMGVGYLMKINGQPSKLPLANNALYSVECSKNKFLNLYEIMIPDIPGNESTAEIYVNALYNQGFDVVDVQPFSNKKRCDSNPSSESRYGS